MNGKSLSFLTCAEIRKRQRTNLISQAELPTEHAVSFPLPTRRWGVPGYAFFASPAVRVSGRPLEQGSPDRWWVLNAVTGHLEIYAKWKAASFAETVWAPQTVPAAFASVAALRTAFNKAEAGLDRVVPKFFMGETCDREIRLALLRDLESALPHALLPQYRALAPDFWAWLETP